MLDFASQLKLVQKIESEFSSDDQTDQTSKPFTQVSDANKDLLQAFEKFVEHATNPENNWPSEYIKACCQLLLDTPITLRNQILAAEKTEKLFPWVVEKHPDQVHILLDAMLRLELGQKSKLLDSVLSKISNQDQQNNCLKLVKNAAEEVSRATSRLKAFNKKDASGNNQLSAGISKKSADEAMEILNELKFLRAYHEIVELISQTNKAGENFLMLAVQHAQPELVKRIFDILHEHDPDFLLSILTVTNKNQANILMFAASRSLEALELILTTINHPSNIKLLQQLMNQKTEVGSSNALMLAAEENKKSVDLLLAAMGKLTEDDQKEILAQVGTNSRCALQNALLWTPNAVESILEAIRHLKLSQQANILKIKSGQKVSENSIVVWMNRQNKNIASCDLITNAIQKISEAFTALSKLDEIDQKSGQNQLMQFIASKKATNLKKYLDYLSSLNQYHALANALAIADIQGNNALMLVAKHMPNHIADMLAVLPDSEPEIRDKILTQTDEVNGWNALMLTLQYSPEAVQPFLKTLKEKDLSPQLIPQDPWSALMLSLAANSPQNAVEEKSPTSDLIDENDTNSVTTDSPPSLLAKQSNPVPSADVVQSRWIALSSAHNDGGGEQSLNTLLTKATEGGWNALMMAIVCSPGEVNSILEAIATLDIDSQKTILAQTNLKGDNALMLVIQYLPKAVMPMLNLIKDSFKEETDRDEKNKFLKIVLTKTNAKSWYDLTGDAQNTPSSVEDLFEDLSKLKSEAQEAILTTENKGEQNALTIAVHYIPEKVEPILIELRRRGLKDLAQILLTKDQAAINPNLLNLPSNFLSDEIKTSIEKLGEGVLKANKTINKLQTSDQNGFPLAVAISNKSFDKVKTILEELKEFSGDNELVKLMAQSYEYFYGWSYLKLAAKDLVDAIPLILAVLPANNPSLLQDILTTPDPDGKYILMYAIENGQKSTLESVLSTVATFDDTTQFKLLAQKSTEGLSALDLAIRKNDEATLRLLLTRIFTLPVENQLTLIDAKNTEWIAKKLNPKNDSAVDAPSDVELELNLCLFLLKRDALLFEEKARETATKSWQPGSSLLVSSKPKPEHWSQANSLYEACKTMRDTQTVTDFAQVMEQARTNFKGQSTVLGHIDRFAAAMSRKVFQSEMPKQYSSLDSSAPLTQEVANGGEMTKIADGEEPHDLKKTKGMVKAIPIFSGSEISLYAGLYDIEPSAPLWPEEQPLTSSQDLDISTCIATINHGETDAVKDCFNRLMVQPLNVQREFINQLPRDREFVKKLNMFINNDVEAKRVFLLCELAANVYQFELKSTSETLSKDDQKKYAQAHLAATDWYNTLSQLIKEEREPSNKEKVPDLRARWSMCIKAGLTEMLLSVLDKNFVKELRITTEKLQLKYVNQSLPSSSNRTLPEQTNKNSQLVFTGDSDLIEKINMKCKIVEGDLLINNKLTAYDEKLRENVLTLAMKKRHTELPMLVAAIKKLEPQQRQSILGVCNHKNLNLINSARQIYPLFKKDVNQLKDLYLLELERLVISSADKDLREKLYGLLNTLNEINNINDTKSQTDWINAIVKTRNEINLGSKAAAAPDNKKPLLNWFKSALNFIGFIKKEPSPEGYGIGFFKPTVNRLLDDMKELPVLTPGLNPGKK